MAKAIFQCFFILALIVGVSITEALMPLALPETQTPNRFYNPDGLEGTLAGWQECRSDGIKLAQGRSEVQISGHCTNGYAVPQPTPVAFSDIKVHGEFSSCAFGNQDEEPYRRFLSATIENEGTKAYVARVWIQTTNPSNLADRATSVVDIWLEPGAKAHKCLGISFDFDTEAEAQQFDQLRSHISVEPVKVYGVSDKPGRLGRTFLIKAPFGTLPEDRSI